MHRFQTHVKELMTYLGGYNWLIAKLIYVIYFMILKCEKSCLLLDERSKMALAAILLFHKYYTTKLSSSGKFRWHRVQIEYSLGKTFHFTLGAAPSQVRRVPILIWFRSNFQSLSWSMLFSILVYTSSFWFVFRVGMGKK